MFRKDESATSASLIALMVGGLIFSASLSTVLLISDDAADGAAETEVGQTFIRAQAGELSQLLFRSPGITNGGADWIPVEGLTESAVYPEDLARLGLMDSNSGLLSFDKFENLRLAGDDANATDNRVNYPEARASLGLDTAELDFHIRAFPTLREVQEILETGKKDEKLKVAYIGHQLGGNGNGNGNGNGGGGGNDIPIENVACGQGSSSDILEITLDVTNNGTGDVLFEIAVDLQFSSASNVRLQDITTRMISGETQSISMDVPALTGRTCSGISTIDVEIHDASGLLDEKSVSFTAGTDPTEAAQEFHLIVPGRAKTTAESITLDFDYANKNDWINVVVREGDDPAGTIVHSPANFKAKNSNSQQKYVIPSGTLTAGHYTAYVTHVATSETLTGTLFVINPGDEPPVYVASGSPPPPPPTGSYDWGPSAGAEADMLASLVQNFCPYDHNSDATAPGSPDPWASRCAGLQPVGTGDVYPDETTPLQDYLVPELQDGSGNPSLDKLNLLVIGSHVQHNPMVHIKGEVEDWVIAGGTLIVFGSEDSNTQWMQSLFHIGIQTSSNGLTTNDADHPILHVADDLSYTDYDNRGQSWKFTGDAANKFNNVLGLGDDTALAVTNPGAYGAGNVIATTFFPYDVFNNGGNDGDEGLRLFNNMLMLGYRTLYLDYGPPLPEGVEVLPSVARSSINHPDLGIVSLDLIVFVWESQG